MKDWLEAALVMILMLCLGAGYVIVWTAVLGAPKSVFQLVVMLVPTLAASVAFLIHWALRQIDNNAKTKRGE